MWGFLSKLAGFLFPFPLTQWKGNLLGKFFYSRNSMGVSAIGVHLTSGLQHIKILICRGQNHLSCVYRPSEGHQLTGVGVVILLTLLHQFRGGRGSETNRRKMTSCLIIWGSSPFFRGPKAGKKVLLFNSNSSFLKVLHGNLKFSCFSVLTFDWKLDGCPCCRAQAGE